MIILQNEKIEAASEMTEIMSDFLSSTFCVHKPSPLGQNLINEMHWHSPPLKDSGIKTV